MATLACGGAEHDGGIDAAPDSGAALPDAGHALDGSPSDGGSDGSLVDGRASPTDTGPPEGGVDPDASLGASFDQSIFMATHNSYSGSERGSIRSQLTRGVRFLELDIHDNDFEAEGDYRVGHDSPGHEVARGGENQSDLRLRAWLGVIDSWSREHPGHAPITIGIDVKDDLTDNPSFATGGIGHLTDIFGETFGSRLYRADALGTRWPTTAELRDRILVVLSGHRETRELYLRDRGADPSVATNTRGQVVVVHHSGSGTLWYWTGQHRADGTIDWRRHGQYDSGTTPAVVLRDDGTVVEVHRSESRARLFYRVGVLDLEYDIRWGPSRDYDDGANPTVALLSDGRVHERHRSPSGDRVWEWYGTIDTGRMRVDWRSNARTSEALFPSSEATSTRGRILVYAGADTGGFPNTLLYATPAAGTQRIRYAQVLFVERQPGDLSVLAVDPLRFFATTAENRTAIIGARADRLVVRAWGFNRASLGTMPPSNFPATDEPHAPWYLDYMRSIGAVTF